MGKKFRHHGPVDWGDLAVYIGYAVWAFSVIGTILILIGIATGVKALVE